MKGCVSVSPHVYIFIKFAPFINQESSNNCLCKCEFFKEQVANSSRVELDIERCRLLSATASCVGAEGWPCYWPHCKENCCLYLYI